MADKTDALAELRERAAIRDLMIRYAAGLDRRDFDLVASTFTQDALAVYSGVAVGPGIDKIIAHVRGLQNSKRSTHHMGHQTVEVNGDQAKSETYATAHVVFTSDGKDMLRTRGLRYVDDLVRVDGNWLVASRQHVVDWERSEPVDVTDGKRR